MKDKDKETSDYLNWLGHEQFNLFWIKKGTDGQRGPSDGRTLHNVPDMLEQIKNLRDDDNISGIYVNMQTPNAEPKVKRRPDVNCDFLVDKEKWKAEDFSKYSHLYIDVDPEGEKQSPKKEVAQYLPFPP